MDKILFFNPRSADHHHRLPNSILQVAASVGGKYDFVVVDGNLEKDPWGKIAEYLGSREFRFFGCTVMPGPQLGQAIPFTRKIRELFPSVITVWGGYFASLYPETAIRSGMIDYLIRGCAEVAFPLLVDCVIRGEERNLNKIPGLVYLSSQGFPVMNDAGPVPEPDRLNPLPYDQLAKFYDLNRYLPRTWLGVRTFSYHSSMGCPHHCSFCGVAGV
ncbi:MAG TPA: hypothetical protein VMC08_08785, partial [Bacteroidales bacterium]|nr:hypothetical protein [Bacteroidales bacterium]